MDEKLRIVQVIPMFCLAGAEAMCENLTYELMKLGHDVTLASLYEYHSPITERLESKGADIRYLNKKRGPDLSMIFKLYRLFKEKKANVVHTHLYCAEYALPAAMLAHVEYRVHTLHNIAEKENGRLARRLNKFFFKHCHLTPVALSERIRASAVREYGIKKEKICVVFNGVDLSHCLPKSDYSVNGSFKILHIGRFSEQKNHMGLLAAFAEFHDKYPKSELWLIGDGEKKKDIEGYVMENGLSSSVRLLGLQADVYPYLNSADIFTLPSNYEGIPMTLIEAMGSALPIVATRVGGVPDMLGEGDAILTNVDENEITRAFESFYTSRQLREGCGQNALERSKGFSSSVMAKEYESIYKTEGRRA